MSEQDARGGELARLNDEQLFERRHTFLTQRLAGGTFRAIAERYNKRAVEATLAAGRPADEAHTVSATTVRKDVERAKAELIETATRDALRGEHRAVLMDMRRANYAAMAAGDTDAAKVVMSTLQREAEMFGLDEPKRTQLGVGTDVEFATDLVDLIRAVGYQPPPDLLFAARGEALGEDGHPRALPAGEVIDAEIDPEPDASSAFDLDAPEQRPADARRAADEEISDAAAAAGGTSGGRPAEPPGPDDGTWSNL